MWILRISHLSRMVRDRACLIAGVAVNQIACWICTVSEECLGPRVWEGFRTIREEMNITNIRHLSRMPRIQKDRDGFIGISSSLSKARKCRSLESYPQYRNRERQAGQRVDVSLARSNT